MSTIDTLAQLTTHSLVAGGGPWEGSGPPFPFVLFPLFWLLVLAAVVTLVITGRRRRERTSGRRAGERLLAERYADGTITEEEYRARRGVLREK